MSIEIQSTGVPPELMADLEDAARYAALGVRDPEVMRRACERMDRMREELRKKVGEMNVAVDLVREVRDEA
jgi:hypothetical protein